MRASLGAGEPLADPAAEAIRRLRALGSAYINFALNDPGLFRTAFCRPDRPIPDVHERLKANGPFALVSGVLDELVATGVLDKARRPNAEIAEWAAVPGLSTLLLAGPLTLLNNEAQANAIALTS